MHGFVIVINNSPFDLSCIIPHALTRNHNLIDCVLCKDVLEVVLELIWCSCELDAVGRSTVSQICWNCDASWRSLDCGLNFINFAVDVAIKSCYFKEHNHNHSDYTDNKAQNFESFFHCIPHFLFLFDNVCLYFLL